MNQHILSVLDLSHQEFTEIVDQAIALTSAKHQQPLLGQNIGIYFSRPSTRTRTSFTLAASNLGASVMTYLPDEMQLTTGESAKDTAGVLARYLDLLVIRCHSIDEMQPYLDQPQLCVINALTDEEHPTQALADMMTIKQHFGQTEGIKATFIGDGGNIATSFLFAGARTKGMELTFLTPMIYSFKTDIWQQAEQLAQASGATIRLIHSPEQLQGQQDVIYATRWRSMGEEKADANWREHYRGFQMTTALFQQLTHKRSIMMHDLPAEWGSEVDHQILDHPQSIIMQQAENKYHTARALLNWLANHP